jgi:hypothetical protein
MVTFATVQNGPIGQRPSIFHGELPFGLAAHTVTFKLFGRLLLGAGLLSPHWIYELGQTLRRIVLQLFSSQSTNHLHTADDVISGIDSTLGHAGGLGVPGSGDHDTGLDVPAKGSVARKAFRFVFH